MPADSIPLPFSPYALTFDSANGFLYVVPYSGDFVAVVDPETGASIATIPTGLYPIAIAFDPNNGDLHVANAGSANVSVIDGTTDTVVNSIPVGSGPVALAYDPTNGDVYVAEPASVNGPSNVTVINATTNSVVGTIDIGYPYPGGGGGANGVTFDSSDNEVFVSVWFFNGIILNAGSGVVAINGSTNAISSTFQTIAEGAALDCVQYDPTAHEVFACDAGSSQVYVLDGKTNHLVRTEGVGSLPVAATYDPANDRILIVNNGSNSVTEIDGTTGLVIGSASVGIGPTSATYDSAKCAVYVANPGSDNLTGLFAGLACTRWTYAVTFTQTGLPLGTSWTASLAGVTNWTKLNSTGFSLTNGTYAYSISSGNNTFSAPGGTLVVDGASRHVPVAFTPVTFNIILSESGLPPGTTWWVNISGQQSLNSFGLPIDHLFTNGTYSYRAATLSREYRAQGGSFTVNGSSFTVTVRFSIVTFSVSFSEHGLPSGKSWRVILSDSSQSSSNATIVYALMNGSYDFRIQGPSGYTFTPTSGTFEVNGTNLSVVIHFTGQATFLGLPTGEGYALLFGIAGVGAAAAVTFTILWRGKKGPSAEPKASR